MSIFIGFPRADPRYQWVKVTVFPIQVRMKATIPSLLGFTQRPAVQTAEGTQAPKNADALINQYD